MDDDDGNKKFTDYRDQDNQDDSSSEMDSDATPTRKPNPKRGPPGEKTNAPSRNSESPQISPKTVTPSGNRQHQTPAPRPPPPPAGHPTRRHNRHPLPSPTLRFTSASLGATSNNNRRSSRHNPETPPRRYVSLPEPSGLGAATANSTPIIRSQQVTLPQQPTPPQQPLPPVPGPSTQPEVQPRTLTRPTRNTKKPPRKPPTKKPPTKKPPTKKPPTTRRTNPPRAPRVPRSPTGAPDAPSGRTRSVMTQRMRRGEITMDAVQRWGYGGLEEAEERLRARNAEIRQERADRAEARRQRENRERAAEQRRWREERERER